MWGCTMPMKARGIPRNWSYRQLWPTWHGCWEPDPESSVSSYLWTSLQPQDFKSFHSKLSLTGKVFRGCVCLFDHLIPVIWRENSFRNDCCSSRGPGLSRCGIQHPLLASHMMSTHTQWHTYKLKSFLRLFFLKTCDFPDLILVVTRVVSPPPRPHTHFIRLHTLSTFCTQPCLVCAPVCMYVSERESTMGLCVFAYVWRPQADMGCLPWSLSALSSKSESLAELTAGQ